MTGRIEAPLRAGDRLPPLELPRASDGVRIAVTAGGRDACVIMLVPPSDPSAGEALAGLAAAADDIEHWYARIVVVAADTAAARRLHEETGRRLSVLSDAQGLAARALGIAASRAALVVADRYGQIYHVAAAGTAAALSGPDEIEEWAKFLATQCPECGVIDEPGHGEWAVE